MGWEKKNMGKWRRRGDDGRFGGEDRRAVRRREAPSLDRGGVEGSRDSVNCQASISAVLTVSRWAAHWLEDNDADCWTAALLTCLNGRREGQWRGLFWGRTDGRTDWEKESVTKREKMWGEALAAKNKRENTTAATWKRHHHQRQLRRNKLWVWEIFTYALKHPGRSSIKQDNYSIMLKIHISPCLTFICHILFFSAGMFK